MFKKKPKFQAIPTFDTSTSRELFQRMAKEYLDAVTGSGTMWHLNMTASDDFETSKKCTTYHEDKDFAAAIDWFLDHKNE